MRSDHPVASDGRRHRIRAARRRPPAAEDCKRHTATLHCGSPHPRANYDFNQQAIRIEIGTSISAENCLKVSLYHIQIRILPIVCCIKAQGHYCPNESIRREIGMIFDVVINEGWGSPIATCLDVGDP